MTQRNSTTNGWTAAHREYMEILANPAERRTKDQIAKHFSVDRTTLYNWEKLPGFFDEVNEITKRRTAKRLPKGWNALMETAEMGGQPGVAAMALILKHRGELIEKTKDVSEHPPASVNQKFIVVKDREQMKEVLKAEDGD